jgi:hypothetical protein
MMGLAEAQRAAVGQNDEIGRLFARVGTAEHPRGRVLTAYRNALRGLQQALRVKTSWQRTLAMREVLNALAAEIGRSASSLLEEAAQVGIGGANRQLAAWGMTPWTEIVLPTAVIEAMTQTRAGVQATVAAQTAQAVSFGVSWGDEARIVGDEERQGVVRPGETAIQLAAGVAALAALAWWWIIQERTRTSGQVWWHQAIAALDERTTDCCLRVHGQAQPLDRPFHLVGTPRYADYLEHPPFHWYCRTSEALVRPQDVNDPLTVEMVDAARAELAARAATGRRVEIHPSHARSRRGGN